MSKRKSKEPEFWILALCKKSGSDKIESAILPSDGIPSEGMELRVKSLAKDKLKLEKLKRKRWLKKSWESHGLIDPELGVELLGSRDRQRIIEQATGNRTSGYSDDPDER